MAAQPLHSTPSGIRMTPRAQWPLEVSMRRGWARAVARPWNQHFTDAHLRVIRGGSSFVAACAAALLDVGAPAVISPPLGGGVSSMWLKAGFTSYCRLSVLRLALDGVPSAPRHLVTPRDVDGLEAIRDVDASAFEPFWRLDRTGLLEAIAATPRAELLIVGEEDQPAGFAIVGYGLALSYLQRVAVAPPWQGQGVGRSLVRSAARRARRYGARAMLLNTQRENDAALALYASEGYSTIDDRLELLRKVP